MYLRISSAIFLISATAWADFSYQQTTRVTGGAMAGMMKMAGAFSAKAREPIVTTVMVRGDRMATVTRDSIQIIDLGKETFTDVNMEKKTYSVMTFAEMSEAMRRMAAKMSQTKQAEGVNFKVDVKQTGQKRDIAGYSAQEFIVKLMMEGTDKKSGQSGSMDMQMNIWVAPSIAGYNEVRDFHRRMAEKMDWSPMASAAGPFAQQNAKGMAELAKQMSKLDGLPVLQVTRVGVSGDGAAGMPSEADMQRAQQQAGEQQRQTPSKEEVATDAARRSAASAALGSRAGAIAGGLSGLGGFGRKKKATEPEKTAPPPPEAPAASPAPTSSGPAALMEMTTEMSGFSASVDGSKLEVPTGFKQIESEMKKALR